MSTPDKKKKKSALLDNLLGGERRRHQVAMITEEGDWNQHESNSGMARVFVVMLLVHVVLIGSIIVYDFIGTEEVQDSPAPVATKTSANDAAESQANQAPVAEGASVVPAAAIASSGEYEVQSGDSLPSIAAKHGVAVNDLIALNHLAESNVELQPLTILKIPALKIAEPARVTTVTDAPPIPVAETPVEAPRVIPFEQDPPMAAVVEAPPVQPLIDTAPPEPVAPLVPVEQTPPAPAQPEVAKVVTPEPAPAPVQVTQTPPQPKPEPKPEAKPAAGARSHTMTKGDTLYSLSRKYGVSVSAIQKANNITNPNAIRQGAKLVIPAK